MTSSCSSDSGPLMSSWAWSLLSEQPSQSLHFVSRTSITKHHSDSWKDDGWQRPPSEALLPISARYSSRTLTFRGWKSEREREGNITLFLCVWHRSMDLGSDVAHREPRFRTYSVWIQEMGADLGRERSSLFWTGAQVGLHWQVEELVETTQRL